LYDVHYLNTAFVIICKQYSYSVHLLLAFTLYLCNTSMHCNICTVNFVLLPFYWVNSLYSLLTAQYTSLIAQCYAQLLYLYNTSYSYIYTPLIAKITLFFT
jgi:hypothetical protein